MIIRTTITKKRDRLAAAARDAVVEYRNEQLRAALEPHDGELSDGDAHAPGLRLEENGFVEGFGNARGHARGRCAVAAVPAGAVDNARAQQQWVDSRCN